MNQRFNFLVQFMLVVLFFLGVLSPVNSQFKTSNRKGNLETTGGNDDLTCFKVGDEIQNDLLEASLWMNLEALKEELKKGLGCDLFIGLSVGNSSNTSFLSINTLIKDQFDSNSFTGNSEQIFNSTRYNNVEFNFAISIPTPTLPCNDGDVLQIRSYTLDLFCFQGHEFQKINPCDYGDLFFLELLETECSLEKELLLRICCDHLLNDQLQETNTPQYLSNSLIGRSKLRNDLNEVIGDEYGAQIVGEVLTLKSKIRERHFVRYAVYNIQGQPYKSGEALIFDHKSDDIDVSNLPVGVYIVVFSTSEEQILSTRVVKF